MSKRFGPVLRRNPTGIRSCKTPFHNPPGICRFPGLPQLLILKNFIPFGINSSIPQSIPLIPKSFQPFEFRAGLPARTCSERSRSTRILSEHNELKDFYINPLPCRKAPNPCRMCSSKESPCNPFRMRSYKTKDLKSFRMCSYKKQGGWGSYC